LERDFLNGDVSRIILDRKFMMKINSEKNATQKNDRFFLLIALGVRQPYFLLHLSF